MDNSVTLGPPTPLLQKIMKLEDVRGQICVSSLVKPLARNEWFRKMSEIGRCCCVKQKPRVLQAE